MKPSNGGFQHEDAAAAHVGRQELEAALRKGVGGIWLDLRPEQYAKLRTTERR